MKPLRNKRSILSPNKDSYNFWEDKIKNTGSYYVINITTKLNLMNYKKSLKITKIVYLKKFIHVHQINFIYSH